MKRHRLVRLLLCIAPLSGACFWIAAAASAATPPAQAGSGAAQTSLPPGAAGKIRADAVGHVSPVPAFRGGGSGWRIDIQANGERTHDVVLTWARRGERAEGQLTYNDALGPSKGAPILLEGTLKTKAGAKRASVRITTEACVDPAGVKQTQRVRIAIAGRAAMSGCGELAVY